jgi:predicted transglutaminase-like cysteine proteinase
MLSRTILLVLTILFANRAYAEQPLYMSVGDNTRVSIGWVDFCKNNPSECPTGPSQPRDIVMTDASWRDLLKVNRWVNETVKPMSDMDHWGVVEKWSIPTDGYGDCEDVVLLKRKMLIDAGWPREALLITVVRQKDGDGHAFLIAKTTKGEFILADGTSEILLWTEWTDNRGYRLVKRQSQNDPNVWVSIGDPRSKTVVAAPSPKQGHLNSD